MVISFVALARVWQRDGVNDDNRLSTSFSELWVYPIPAGLYLIKNLMQARRPGRNKWELGPRLRAQRGPRVVVVELILSPVRLPQYYIFLYVDAPSYQILKNLNIISTGVLYRRAALHPAPRAPLPRLARRRPAGCGQPRPGRRPAPVGVPSGPCAHPPASPFQPVPSPRPPPNPPPPPRLPPHPPPAGSSSRNSSPASSGAPSRSSPLGAPWRS